MLCLFVLIVVVKTILTIQMAAIAPEFRVSATWEENRLAINLMMAQVINLTATARQVFHSNGSQIGGVRYGQLMPHDFKSAGFNQKNANWDEDRHWLKIIHG
jgi:hypothetical protein